MPSSGGSHDRRKAIFVEMTCLKDHGHRSRERVKDSVVGQGGTRIQRKCQYDRECYEYYPGAAPGSMTCFEVVRDHYGQRKCHSDRQCYEYQPDAAPGSMTCFKAR
ncbi:hypothetical protein P8452_06606 [Trifolium repens]|nr:hypothetical protein P8452_06606 [Trifolium repens]